MRKERDILMIFFCGETFAAAGKNDKKLYGKSLNKAV